MPSHQGSFPSAAKLRTATLVFSKHRETIRRLLIHNTPPPDLNKILLEPMDSSEDVDDYMSMVIMEPAKPEKETSIQRQARKRREAGESLMLFLCSLLSY